MSELTEGQGSGHSLWQQASYGVRRLVMAQIGACLSIGRFAFRQPRVPPSAKGFSYHRTVLPLMIGFVIVSAAEMVVVDVLVRRWPSVRIALLVLGGWVLVWMLGMLCALLTRPHAVGPTGVRVRSGTDVDLSLPWESVDSVTVRKRIEQGKQVSVTIDEHQVRTLHLRMQQETNIEITLRQPAEVRLPKGAQTISRVHLFADLPQSLISEVGLYRPDLVPRQAAGGATGA